MQDWVARLLASPGMTRMGHQQCIDDANLGLGWLYYSLARIIRPQKVVVIGSYRGFVPLILGKALADNLNAGKVIFIDPSLVDDFWKNPQAVLRHFAQFDIANIEHFLMTTQQFTQSATYQVLDRLGMVFIDGYHSEEQARFDYEAFDKRLDREGIILFHDSTGGEISRIYGAEHAYQSRVKCFVDQLKQDPGLQVFDLPFGRGVSLVRKLAAT
jgi:predicted O-methyltransferase YrrM